MLKIIKKKTNLIFLIFAIILSIPAVIGLLHLGFPLTDDGNWMVIRFSAFYEDLRSGQFPVRFLTRLNYGYGYPVADFLYPLFMYIGVPIHILGFNFVNTIKIILGLSLIFSSIFTSLWLRKFFDNIASLTGAIFYTFFPYHLFDIYKRGSVGEALSFSILPFVLWQIERKNLLLTSLGIALLIVSHNILALLFLPLIFFYILFKQKKSLKFNLLSFIFGFLISSFFWIPAFYDTQYTVFASTTISEFSSYFINNNLGILGIITAFLILESSFYLIRSRDKLFLVLFLVFLVLSFLTLSFSEIIWKVIPFTNLIQFPFRLISLLIPLGAFMIAYLLSKEKITKKYILVVIYFVLIFVSSYAFLFPKSFQYLPETFYSTSQDTTTVKNEYMPKWVKNIPVSKYKSKVEILNGKETPAILVQKANKTSFNVFLEKSRMVQVNTVYFPGWKAYVNGKEAKINHDNDQGLITFNLEKGQDNVEVIFRETPVRLFSDLLSIIGAVGLFIFYYLLKKRKISI